MDHWQRNEAQRFAAWDFLKKCDVDIAILQETSPAFGCLDGYNIYFQSLPIKKHWGSAIITKKYNAYKHPLLSSYEGSQSLICYDFEIEKNKIVTIINLYGKMDSNGYCTTTVHHMLSDITPIVWGKPKNLIIMAGDLNTSTQWDEKYKNKAPAHKLVFDRIENMEFINCTMERFGEHRQTFVRKNSFPYQDDYIFIKGHKNKQWEIEILEGNDILNCSDHYPVELKIEI